MRFRGPLLETFSEVEVVRVSRVEVAPPPTLAGGRGPGLGGASLWSNAPGAGSHVRRFDVSFWDSAGRPVADEANVTHNVMFACDAHPAGVARTLPGFDPASGRFYCDVDLAPPSKVKNTCKLGVVPLDIATSLTVSEELRYV